VRQRLANGEAELVRVERAAEQHRYDLGTGARFRAGRLELGEARLMVIGQLIDAGVQAAEGQTVRGQHEGGCRHLALYCVE